MIPRRASRAGRSLSSEIGRPRRASRGGQHSSHSLLRERASHLGTGRCYIKSGRGSRRPTRAPRPKPSTCCTASSPRRAAAGTPSSTRWRRPTSGSSAASRPRPKRGPRRPPSARVEGAVSAASAPTPLKSPLGARRGFQKLGPTSRSGACSGWRPRRTSSTTRRSGASSSLVGLLDGMSRRVQFPTNTSSRVWRARAASHDPLVDGS